MEIERIRALRLADPFKPFYVVTTDGSRFLVDQPYYIGMFPDGRRIGVATDTGGMKLIRPDDIRSVDMVQETTRKA